MFRQALLAKHGKLIFIPQRELSRHSIDDLAAWLPLKADQMLP